MAGSSGRALAVLPLLLLAGCLSGTPGEPPGTPGAAGGAFEPVVNGTSSEAVAVIEGESHIERTFQGVIRWRLGGDEPPRAAHEGDPPTFCFLVPDGATALAGTLAWEPPQPMGLEFYPPDGEGHRSWGNAAQAFLGMSPLRVEVVDPQVGTWFAYAGPPAAGVQITWRLDMSWTVARPGVTEAETVHAEPCT